jgi:hypothetical protein
MSLRNAYMLIPRRLFTWRIAARLNVANKNNPPANAFSSYNQVINFGSAISKCVVKKRTDAKS